MDFEALTRARAEFDALVVDLVGMIEKSGATEVGSYFTNYARVPRLRLETGTVDGRPALLARQQPDGPVLYCVFMRFVGTQIQSIRDYRYARYVFDDARSVAASGSPNAG